MPANFVLLEKITVGAAGASSVTFSGIPQTGYTDLVVKFSARSDRAGNTDSPMRLYPNGSSSGITLRFLQGNGSTASSGTESTFSAYMGETPAATATASTFGNGEIYIPNYTSANYKSISTDVVTENNATAVKTQMFAYLWSNTAAITSLQILDGLGNFVANSTFYLYGVAKLGTTPAIVPYATGGDTIMTDGTYWYHAFKSSGTFTPAKGLSCDVLVVAGGGGASSYYSGGGGAGGLRSLAAQSFANATAYTVTVGAGGAGGTGAGSVTTTQGKVGNNSSVSGTGLTTITASGGGQGNTWANNPGTGSGVGYPGGSGGGASLNFVAGGAGNVGSYSPVEGYAGGAGGKTGGNETTGGGGGAGGVGAAAGNGTTGGNGGIGATSSVINAMGAATATGVLSGGNYYFAGGGGGASAGTGAAGTGGLGGGGNGGLNTGGSTGTANTGGGSGGGAGSDTVSAGGGGSGIVIIRYAV
jgi:hypothetical protein